MLLRHICHTPRGAYIRVATWSFTGGNLANALIAAHDRGVVVRVLMAKGQMNTTAVERLQRELTSRGESWIRGVRNSARGTDRFDGAWTTMHQKSWLFSTVGSRKRVSVVTSANATAHARDAQYTDALQFVGKWKVYNKIRDVFVQQTKDDALARPFRSWSGEGVGLTFTPWNRPGMADPVVRRIRNVPDHAHLRIANSAWYGGRGDRIARAVAAHERATGGKDVWVLASKPFGANVRQILRGAGVTIYDGYFGPNRYHHLKFMTARWRGSDGNAVTRVWAGSENWSAKSRGNDELVARVKGFRAHQGYVRFFDRIVRR